MSSIGLAPVSPNKRRRKGGAMWCRVTDESVVVMNPRPMKAGNRLEGKTGGQRLCVAGPHRSKAEAVAKGQRQTKACDLTTNGHGRKTTAAEMPMGTGESGATSLLVPLWPAQQSTGPSEVDCL